MPHTVFHPLHYSENEISSNFRGPWDTDISPNGGILETDNRAGRRWRGLGWGPSLKQWLPHGSVHLDQPPKMSSRSLHFSFRTLWTWRNHMTLRRQKQRAPVNHPCYCYSFISRTHREKSIIPIVLWESL